jgi:hypothetical protein
MEIAADSAKRTQTSQTAQSWSNRSNRVNVSRTQSHPRIALVKPGQGWSNQSNRVKPVKLGHSQSHSVAPSRTQSHLLVKPGQSGSNRIKAIHDPRPASLALFAHLVFQNLSAKGAATADTENEPRQSSLIKVKSR